MPQPIKPLCSWRGPSPLCLSCDILTPPSHSELKSMIQRPGWGPSFHNNQERNPSSTPWLFIRKKLSLAERNYDTDNRELLAVKLAQEEWCHWLEGGLHLLTIYTYLECVKSAKRLTSHQARWALFFSRFDFTLSYHPGSKNTKALSLLYQHPHVRLWKYVVNVFLVIINTVTDEYERC